MKVRIVSDGSIMGTRVEGPDGSDLGRFINRVDFRHDGGSIPRVELSLTMVELECEGRASMVGPNGKAVRRIEYEDGTVDTFDG